MTEAFDPYYRWLGILPKDQPPNHYRLMGLELFESDPHVIDTMAGRHMEYLQQITDGPHVNQAQRLLNELASARRCLLDPEKKAAYDAGLKATVASGRKKPEGTRALEGAASSPKAAPPAPQIQPIVPRQKARGPLSRARRSTPGAGAGSNRAVQRARWAKRSERRRPAPRWAVRGILGVLVTVAVTVWLFRGDDGDTGGGGRAANAPAQRPLGYREDGLESLLAIDSQSADPVDWQLEVDRQPGSSSSRSPVDKSSARTARPNTAASSQGRHNAKRSDNKARPASIPWGGLLLWLDASDPDVVELDEQARVRCWLDKSDHRWQATMEQADRRPQLAPGVLAGRPAMRFSGQHGLEIPGSSKCLSSDTDYTIVFVARGRQGTLLSKGTGEFKGGVAISDGVTSLRAGGEELGNTKDDATRFRVRAIVAGPGSLRWYVDGQQCGDHSGHSHTVTSRNQLRLGCFHRTGKGVESFFRGDLAELLVYDRPLEDDERVSLEGHLRNKWLASAATPFPFERPAAALQPAGSTAAADSAQSPEKPATDAKPLAPASGAKDSPPEDVADGERSQGADEPFCLHVNLGGEPWQDPQGNRWLESHVFDDETFGHEGGQPVKIHAAPDPVAGSAQRGLTGFRAVVPDGVFEVRLYFSENWTNDPDRRVFSVAVEGRPPNFFRAPGMSGPYIHQIPKVAVKDGRLDIDFFQSSQKSSSILNGISIRQLK